MNRFSRACSCRTTLSLQYAPHSIACGAIYLAGEFISEPVRGLSGFNEWWDKLGSPLYQVEGTVQAVAGPLLFALTARHTSQTFAFNCSTCMNLWEEYPPKSQGLGQLQQ